VGALASNHEIDVKADLYAVGDGLSHPLSTHFTGATALADAQAAFPHVEATFGVALTMQLDWASIQEAILANTDPDITQHRKVIVPPGRYYIDRSIEYVWDGSTSFVLNGAGAENTFLESHLTSGSVIKMSFATPGHVQWEGGLRDFTIKNMVQTGNAKGLYFRGVYRTVIENVRILSMKGDGVYILNTLGDPLDSTTYLNFINCYVTDCKEWGINVDISNGHNEMSFLTLDQCWIHQNGTTAGVGGGMRWRGQICEIRDSAFTLNRNFAFRNYGPTTSLLLAMDRVTFENNYNRNLVLESCVNSRFTGCQFKNNDTYKATSGVKIDAATGSVVNATFIGTIFRVTASNVPYTGFDISGANALYTSIKQTRWDDFYPSIQTKFSDSGVRTRIEDDAEIYPYAASAVNTTMLAGTSYTPDLNRYKIHAIKLSGAGIYTIPQPSSNGSALGKEMVLDLYNPSSAVGNASIVFPGNWSVSGPPAIAPGVHRSASFYFNNQIGWVQVGAWR